MADLLTAIDAFLIHCRVEKRLSAKTIKAYATDLKQLANFLKENHYTNEISLITKAELRAYLETLEVLKPKSMKRKIASVKVLFNYLEFDDHITSNPLRKIRIKIKEPQLLPKVMDIKEIQDIIELSYHRLYQVKDKKTYQYLQALRGIVVVELLFSTGARVSEIANLKIENVNVQTGAIVIKGKGNKERIVQVCNAEVLKILNEYNQVLLAKNSGRTDFFLINRFSRKLSDQSIRNLVSHLARGANIKKHITPHVFRHSFATLLLEQGVDIKYIQTLLGHSSIMTTQIYTHVNREKQIRILENKHPRRSFSMSSQSE